MTCMLLDLSSASILPKPLCARHQREVCCGINLSRQSKLILLITLCCAVAGNLSDLVRGRGRSDQIIRRIGVFLWAGLGRAGLGWGWIFTLFWID